MGDQWKTPSRGEFKLEEMCNEIRKFISENNTQCKISIGTDAQRHANLTKFVTVVMVHRVGNGAQYYWRTEYVPYVNSLRQKIMHEAALTFEYKETIKSLLHDVLDKYTISIVPDVDIGEYGKTNQFIKEIKNMFNGFGPKEEVRIKPYSIAASCVADKYTK